MIEIQGVSKSFNGIKVLENINLSVRNGETLVIIGPSGSGKTTLLKHINKLYIPDSGRILLEDQDIRQLDTVRLRRRIGYVIQEVGLFPHLTLFENIALVAKILKWDTKRIRKKIDELRHLLNIGDIDLENKYMHEISGGQRQRVGIARALITDPDIILLDEPFGALDPVTRVSVRKEFRKLEDLIQKTMVMVTHDISEALETADRICVMDKGKIMQTGTASELLFKPVNSFIKDFFHHDLFKHQMQLITIEDVLPYLKRRMKIGEAYFRMEGNMDIFSIFNHYESHGNDFLFVDKERHEHFFNSEEIMNAFFQYILHLQH
jgi:osmoprotectant transport system ATP-binding protein